MTSKGKPCKTKGQAPASRQFYCNAHLDQAPAESSDAVTAADADVVSGVVPGTASEDLRTPALSAEEAAAALESARESKQQGNTHFQAGRLEAAIECYTHAIELAPPDEPERAVFFANRAACYAKMGEHLGVVEDCTAALTLRPEYTKALMRRALAREQLDQSTEALEDAKEALRLEPDSKEAKAAVPRLEKASEAKLEAQKEEMLGKLKDLGNSVLGRFGMSLDNFKADKDPSTGSYNISFQQ